MHESLGEFEIWPDSTTSYEVERMKKSNRLVHCFSLTFIMGVSGKLAFQGLQIAERF